MESRHVRQVSRHGIAHRSKFGQQTHSHARDMHGAVSRVGAQHGGAPSPRDLLEVTPQRPHAPSRARHITEVPFSSAGHYKRREDWGASWDGARKRVRSSVGLDDYLDTPRDEHTKPARMSNALLSHRPARTNTILSSAVHSLRLCILPSSLPLAIPSARDFKRFGLTAHLVPWTAQLHFQFLGVSLPLDNRDVRRAGMYAFPTPNLHASRWGYLRLYSKSRGCQIHLPPNFVDGFGWPSHGFRAAVLRRVPASSYTVLEPELCGQMTMGRKRK
ncbi:hypothetical protein B0H11DRAFT_1900590 [Mycena galericulata]|nr:hypothetical protein B0H11DRAFT_1900590 [Mycena galericulata]